MTWDQAFVWLIWPLIVAIIIGGGGLWLTRDPGKTGKTPAE